MMPATRTPAPADRGAPASRPVVRNEPPVGKRYRLALVLAFSVILAAAIAAVGFILAALMWHQGTGHQVQRLPLHMSH